MNLNKVEIAGGLTRSPDLRFLPSGMAVCEFTVAVNGARYDSTARQQVVTTTFVAVNAWSSLAEEVVDMGLVQGDAVYVMGELEQREIEKKDGTKERKTRVTASVVVPTRRRGTSLAPPRSTPAAPPGEHVQDPWV